MNRYIFLFAILFFPWCAFAKLEPGEVSNGLQKDIEQARISLDSALEANLAAKREAFGAI